MAVTEKTWEERAQEIGSSVYMSIKEMVDALNVDWDRLEELRKEVEEYVNADGVGGRDAWEEENPDLANEMKELNGIAGVAQDEEDALELITEDPLSVEVRSDWRYPSSEADDVEFRILLGTGGPAYRIIGELDGGSTPVSARLEVQDWFQPWTEYREADENVLLQYCQVFYFGE